MKHKHLNLASLGVSVAVALSLVIGGSVRAWGPERPTYTNADPANHAVFNSITDNAAVGDERDFVRIEEKGAGRVASSEIEIEAGKEYEVYIYYHNDASETYNDAKYNYVGIARDVRLSSGFPMELKKGERGAVTGRITASNTDPKAVWDEAYVIAKEDMTLDFVPGTAKIYNLWDTNDMNMSTMLFSTEGTLLGFKELNGVLFGCDKYSGQVVYTIKTQAVSEPAVPEPEEPTTPAVPQPKPEVPQELPETGPAEIVLAVIIVLSLLAGGIYWYRTHKVVKKVTKKAKGRK